MAHVSSTIITSIVDSRNTLITQAQRAGFNVDDYVGAGITEISAMYTNNHLDMLFKRNDDEPDKLNAQQMYVRYSINKTLRPATIETIYDDLYNVEEKLAKNDILVIVSNSDMNATVKATLIEMYDKYNVLIIVQNIKRLQFNVFDNNIVPPHTILTDIEKRKVSAKYNVTDAQYPTISRFDPAALAIYMRPEQLCRIDRKSKTTLVDTTYRLCINK